MSDQLYHQALSANRKLLEENARLKALTVEMDKTINISQSGYRELKAEVERLTKAGDEMAFMINESFDSPPNTPQSYIDAYLLLGIKKWVSSKEGKPSV